MLFRFSKLKDCIIKWANINEAVKIRIANCDEEWIGDKTTINANCRLVVAGKLKLHEICQLFCLQIAVRREIHKTVESRLEKCTGKEFYVDLHNELLVSRRRRRRRRRKLLIKNFCWLSCNVFVLIAFFMNQRGEWGWNCFH